MGPQLWYIDVLFQSSVKLLDANWPCDLQRSLSGPSPGVVVCRRPEVHLHRPGVVRSIGNCGEWTFSRQVRGFVGPYHDDTSLGLADLQDGVIYRMSHVYPFAFSG